MAHEIVTVGHRGTLEVDNHPGEGATFSMTLPAPAQERPPGKPAA
jgi:signal transduction histidine kinase